MALGGYVAEEMIFGDLTTGPSSDLQVGTALARDMVTKYGMSTLGPMALEGLGGRVVFGKGLGDREYSEDVSAKIDAEVGKIMNESFVKARKVLKENRKALDAIATRLIENETIEQEEYEKNHYLLRHYAEEARRIESGEGVRFSTETHNPQ